MRKIIVLIMVAIFTVVGCEYKSGQVTEGTSGNNQPPTESSSAKEAARSSEESEPAPPVNPKFGETYTYEDGLAVTVSPPQPYTPSEWAFVGEPRPPAFIVFDVKIVNGTQQNYDPVIFSVTMQSANVEEEQVFDSADGIEGSPSTVLLPGRESVFRIAFGATNPNDLVMEVSPSFEHQSVIFTS
jgi:hypothetical protein